MSGDRTSAEPIAIAEEDLAKASCLECRGPVWSWQPDDSTRGIEAITLDWANWQGMTLLSLHPCRYELEAEDLDDPDWGWVQC